jgi:hypothetical protein
VCVDVERLVNQIQAALLAIITKNMLLLISVPKFDNFVSNQVIDIASGVDKSKTIR